MKIEILAGLRPVVVEQASRVLVCSDDGTPVAVASEWQPGVVMTAHAADRNFAAVLAGLGIDRTVVVDRYTPRPIDDVI